MNKKRIRQMNTALLRRLGSRPAAEYLAGQEKFLRALEGENYIQRFAPLYDGGRIRCADVLALTEQVKRVVREKTGFVLEREIRVVK